MKLKIIHNYPGRYEGPTMDKFAKLNMSPKVYKFSHRSLCRSTGRPFLKNEIFFTLLRDVHEIEKS